jgi:hypothetical protein
MAEFVAAVAAAPLVPVWQATTRALPVATVFWVAGSWLGGYQVPACAPTLHFMVERGLRAATIWYTLEPEVQQLPRALQCTELAAGNCTVLWPGRVGHIP